MVKAIRPEMKRAAVYARVSTDDQAESGYSLEDQEQRCRAQAMAKGWDVVLDRYVEDGVSGVLRHRPALDRLLADIRAEKVNVVIVTKMDRLARNLRLLLELWDTIEGYGASVVVIEESIDTSTSVGRLIRNVLGSISEFERDTIQARTAGGKRAKLCRGEIIRATAPYGYTYVPREGARIGYLEEDPLTAPVVRRIFEMVAAGTSTIKVAETLTRQGVPTPKGGPSWAFSTVRTIIVNSTYKGQAPHGQQTVYYIMVKGQDGKEEKQAKRKRGEATAFASCPALVEPDLWQRANVQLAANRKTSRRNARHDYLLGGGLITCGICGHTMTGMQRRSSMYYRCSHIDQDGKRVMHSVNGRDAEEAVWSEIAGLLGNQEKAAAALSVLADEASAEARELDLEVTNTEKASANAEEQAQKLLDLYLSGRIAAERYETKAPVLEDQIRRLRERAADLASRRQIAIQQVLPLQEVKALVEYYATRMDAMAFGEKRTVLTTFVTSLVAYPERVVIQGYLGQKEVTTATTVSEPCKRSNNNRTMPFTLHVSLRPLLQAGLAAR